MILAAGIGAVAAGHLTAQEPPEPPPDAQESQLEVSRKLSGVHAQLRVADGSHVVPLRLERLRLMYFLAVADEAYVPEVQKAIERLASEAAGSEIRPILDAFAGATDVVRGKHAFWPHQKVSHVRDGLSTLDAAVEADPEALEPRYLRLLSCFYLPFFFGRGDTAEEDMTALTRLLPAGRGTLSKDAYLAVSDFVLDNGELTEEERARLIAAVHAVSAESSGGRPGLKDVPGVGELATRGSTGS